jgi:hypothetical protein
MVSFFEKEEYNEHDINSLISNEVEESIHLDFKDALALGRSDNKKKEISKDIASFANSDGGIIIYGIKEENHKASLISFINGDEYTKEWIDQLVNSTIQRRIPELKIFPIRFDGDIKKTVYVVKIPKSLETPHLSRDKRYYKRFNFESVAMEEYEIRQLYDRREKSILKIANYSVGVKELNDKIIKLHLNISIYNPGDIPESKYKTNIYFNGFNKGLAVSWERIYSNYNYTVLEGKRVKVSTEGNMTVYPSETVNVIRLNIEVDREMYNVALKETTFEIKLFYSNGQEDMNGDFAPTISHIQEIINANTII